MNTNSAYHMNIVVIFYLFSCRPHSGVFFGALLVPVVVVYVLTLVVNFATVVYSTVSSFHTDEIQARRTLVMPNLFSSIILNLVFGVVIVFLMTATTVNIVGTASTALQYLFALAVIVHGVLTLAFVFVRAKEARGVCNNLFHCVTGRSARYTFKPTYKTSRSGEIAAVENEYATMSAMGPVKEKSPVVDDEVRPLRQESQDSEAEPVKVDLEKHAEDEEEEQETVMINEGAEDGDAGESETKEDEIKEGGSD